MGSCCSSCFNSGSREELLSPDLETRRRQLAEAAENRAKQNEARGLSNPEKVQRKIEQARAREDKMEKYASQAGNPALKVMASQLKNYIILNVVLLLKTFGYNGITIQKTYLIFNLL
ncbi:Small VCP/p97-interacting protein [Frankliniella fusca]|uniref:Small VCP/p97-interacting protein n=1 Tax=Frankliniella fusca TaxID=407009 RepID=A0AAE1HXR1_9NEOP|nr:Small VCP/p97-interacting protein [Frankliniella fusca]